MLRWGFRARWHRICKRCYAPGEARVEVPLVPKKLLKAEEEAFVSRHVGPEATETSLMLSKIGFTNLQNFLSAILPSVPSEKGINLPEPLNEKELAELIHEYGQLNKTFKSFIGQGYYGTTMPAVIRRNVLENPAWYTPYTPYQPEISQGRLESLLNFQTMITELTGLPIANASLLDEATAACEAMAMTYYASGGKKKTFIVDRNCFPRTLECLRTRAEGIGIRIVVDDQESYDDTFGYFFQYPDKEGRIGINEDLLQRLKSVKIPIISATDLLGLTLIKPPGELAIDIAVGSTQRFGLPFGYGGPHAAFLSCKEEYKRLVPGRIVGISKDVFGERALRLALQTREQHIRRERATSNICTAQALPANLAVFYAIYHGPEGLKRIAARVNEYALHIADIAKRLGHRVQHEQFFDTIIIEPNMSADYYHKLAEGFSVNLGRVNEKAFSISFDETHDEMDVKTIMKILAGEQEDLDPDAVQVSSALSEMEPESVFGIPDEVKRQNGNFMQQAVFREHRTETKMMRYIHWLQSKDLSLVHSMIPLGSCTMKLNGAAELQPLGSPAWMDIHPMAPAEQTKGYEKLLKELKQYLGEITGLKNVSLQPNSGAQGEYAGLRVIKAFHRNNGDEQRTKCLVPASAHGTNPASAIMAGLEVVKVPCLANGSLDLTTLAKIIEADGNKIAVIMVTYPSTFGSFDESILKACEMVKAVNGKVYLDGANMNAMVGYLRPVDVGADVCHLNLHKTFCIPHGGGGPGAGPIAVSDQLAPFLPSDPHSEASSRLCLGPISQAPFGSASILTISWAYILLMGLSGLQEATFKALLNANYMMACLAPHYPIGFTTGRSPYSAHEFIVDLRPFVDSANITALDVAKRLQDYGFHSPTMSWPINNTLMIEPTESESKDELDRFIQAMISIRHEIAAIERGEMNKAVNPLKMAPHAIAKVMSDNWDRPYSREQAVFPLPYLKKHKFWPSVSRLDDVYGDQNLVCSASC